MCLAIPGKVIAVESHLDGALRSGKVAFGGIQKPINFSMVPEVKVGDYVLVHVGVAISVIDEQEAQLTLKYLRQMGELEELEDAG